MPLNITEVLQTELSPNGLRHKKRSSTLRLFKSSSFKLLQISRNTLLGPGQCIRNSHRHYLPGKDTIQVGCLVWDDLQITDDGRSIKLSRKAIMVDFTNLNEKELVAGGRDVL